MAPFIATGVATQRTTSVTAGAHRMYDLRIYSLD